MGIYLLSAAVLMIVLGVAHSVIGEFLIFRHWRSGQHSQKIQEILPLRHRRIIWASWHLATIFGWALAAVMFYLPSLKRHGVETTCVETILAISMLMGALLVLGGTRGRHPGWVVMSIISALIWFG